MIRWRDQSLSTTLHSRVRRSLQVRHRNLRVSIALTTILSPTRVCSRRSKQDRMLQPLCSKHPKPTRQQVASFNVSALVVSSEATPLLSLDRPSTRATPRASLTCRAIRARMLLSRVELAPSDLKWPRSYWKQVSAISLSMTTFWYRCKSNSYCSRSHESWISFKHQGPQDQERL